MIWVFFIGVLVATATNNIVNFVMDYREKKAAKQKQIYFMMETAKSE